MALRLAAEEEGARVAVHSCWSGWKAAAVVTEIESAGGEAIFCSVPSLSRAGEINRLFAELERGFGSLDILINNAAVFAATPVGETTGKIMWDAVTGCQPLEGHVFLCTQRAVRRCCEKRPRAGDQFYVARRIDGVAARYAAYSLVEGRRDPPNAHPRSCAGAQSHRQRHRPGHHFISRRCAGNLWIPTRAWRPLGRTGSRLSDITARRCSNT